jgi:hypothetical protein
MASQLAEALDQIQQQLAEGRTRLTKQRAQCHALLREVKLARAAASDRSWELADVEQRLRDLNEQREGPGDLLMEREIAHLTSRRTKLEEDVLAHLLLVDDLSAQAQAAEQALAVAAQEWATREATLIVEHDYIAQLIVTAQPGSAA